MKKYHLLIAFVVFGLVVAKAQDDFQSINEQIRAQMDIEKNLFFTQRIGLTQDQAVSFWKLYNEFQKQDSELRQKEEELIEKGATAANLSNAQYAQIYASIIANEKKKRELKDNFFKQLDKILTPKQKILFCKTTKEYKKLLLQKLKLYAPPMIRFN